MRGEDLRAMLEADPNAAFLESDNNEYLVSYRFDTGAEVAFDPRTTTKCSVFVSKLPERMKHRLGSITHYPPENPSTALTRVSSQLADTRPLFKVDGIAESDGVRHRGRQIAIEVTGVRQHPKTTPRMSGRQVHSSSPHESRRRC